MNHHHAGRLFAAALIAGVAVAVTFALIGVRSSDLEKIAQANCTAINELIEQRNKANAEGRGLVEQLIEENESTPPGRVERERLERFLDALFYPLGPYDC